MMAKVMNKIPCPTEKGSVKSMSCLNSSLLRNAKSSEFLTHMTRVTHLLHKYFPAKELTKRTEENQINAEERLLSQVPGTDKQINEKS